MTGHRNEENKGDVLLIDGEVLGEWAMQEAGDFSIFTASGASECTLEAPSAWMLHGSIAKWFLGNTVCPATPRTRYLNLLRDGLLC